MKTKITFAVLFFILSISATTTPPSQETEFQIQAENQKSAAKDVYTIVIALADFITDSHEYPNQAGAFEKNSKIYQALCPFYMKSLPTKDPWGNNYLVFCGTSGNGQYGISECEDDDFVVVCLGMDGKKESWKYDPSDPSAGLFEVKARDDFNKDLINWNGSWIRAPKPVHDSYIFNPEDVQILGLFLFFHLKLEAELLI